MLGHDNLQWSISLTLCLLCKNGVISSVIKPDILVALDGIAGFDLTEADMSKHHIWPHGIVYYYIDDYSFDKVLRDRIRSYLDQISTSTGLQFMEIPQPPKDDNSRYAFFLNRKSQLECGDVAYQNFTSEGVQKVVLGYDCIKSEDLAEIILSLVGVPPQHNSPDRDDYITVNFDNILPDKHYLFKKMQPEDWMFNKFEYDFGSAGHYTTHKHTLNGAETITPKNRETYKEGNKDLSATDIKKIRTTYNYISLKGKNQIKVPECSKLFVTGSNFSNYIPTTKSDKELTYPEPNHSGDTTVPDHMKTNMSQEINSNESTKPKNSTDIVEEEYNKEQTKNDTKNLNDETELEISNNNNYLNGKKNKGNKQKLNKKISVLTEKKKSLLKYSGKDKRGKKNNTKMLSYVSTSVENRNMLLNGNEEQSDYPDTSKLNKQKTFLSEKKKMFLIGSGKYNKKKLSHKLDYFTGDEGHNKHLNGKEEQSDYPDPSKLYKQKTFLAEKKKLLLIGSGKDNKKKLSHKLDYFTGDESHNKHLNGKEEQSDYPDPSKLHKQKTFLAEKKKLLLIGSGKNNKKKLSHKLDYFTGDEGHNKYLNAKEEESDSFDAPKFKKGKNFISAKKERLLKHNGKDEHSKKNKLKNVLLQSDYSAGDEDKNHYLLNKREERDDQPDTLNKKIKYTLLKNNGKNKRGKNKNKDKLLLQSDYSTGDEGHNIYLKEKQKVHFL